MYQRVSTEEFFKVIGPLNVTLEIRGNYPYKTLFRLKQVAFIDSGPQNW